MFSFIHAADLHLDSPLKGLSAMDASQLSKLRDATRGALTRLVDLAIEEKVDFVVIAGDLYDGDIRDYRSTVHLAVEFSRLKEANIPVFVIAGNHDAANRMTRLVRFPANVFYFPSDIPTTTMIESIGVAIHGQSFREQAVREDLSRNYPAPVNGYFNLGILHTCGEGREGHERYAPCSIESLKSKGYDYWALGHVHQREVLCEKPYIAFSGNLQGRHAKETGPKGCLVVKVDSSRNLTVEFKSLDVIRWEEVVVDVSSENSMSGVLDLAAVALAAHRHNHTEMTSVVRMILNGATTAHDELYLKREHFTAEIRSLAIEVGGGEIFIEKVHIATRETRAADFESNIAEDAIGEIRSLFRLIEENPERLSKMDLKLDELRQKLPHELQSGYDLLSQASMMEMVGEARSRLFISLEGKSVEPLRDTV